MKERNIGRGFITLITVATLFFSVAIPSTSFAKPEGEPDKASEIVLWHKTWEKDKAVDKFLKKFTEEDLKPQDDATPSKKVVSWMKLLSKKDEAKQAEFISKFVTDPGVEKKENIEPYKMAQALRSVLVEKHKSISKDDKLDDKAKEEAFSKEAEKLWKWLSIEEVPGLEKAYGLKASAMSKFVQRAVKILSKLIKEGKLEDMSEEELLKELFNDETKKELGIDPSEEAKKADDEEGEEQAKKGDDKKIKDLEDKIKALQDALAASQSTPVAPQGPGEQVDLAGLEAAVQAACANVDDNNDDLADLARALEDQIENLERQLADNVNDDNNNNDQALLDQLLAGLQNQDDQEEEQQAQQAAPTPPPAAPPTSTPPLADSGEELPETPQPLGPQPLQPQQPNSFVDGEPVKAQVAGLRGPQFDYRDGLISASRGVLGNMKDELGMGNLLGGMTSALNPLMNPMERWRLAGIKKMQAYTNYSEAKTRRDQHAAAAEALRSELRGLEQGFEPLFAKYNPTAALAIQKGEAKIKELEDQKKQLQQQGSQQNADGSPAFDRNGIQQQLSQIQQAIRRQEEEIATANQAKANFIANQDGGVKDLKAAMEKHAEYESEFGSQVKKFANEYQTALTEESTAASQLQQPQQGIIPTIGGGQAMPFTTGSGVNRFSGVGVRTGQAATGISSSPTDAVRGSLAGGGPR